MANIVVSIHNPLLHIQGRYPYFEYFVNKLCEYGNNVLLVETQKHRPKYGKIPSKILTKIKEFKPDLFILMNNNFWDVTKYFDVPMVVYDVDSPNVYSDIDKLIENIDRYKFFTISSSGTKLIQDATGAKKENICYIPPFSGIYSDENAFQDINIGFCGSHWLWNDLTEIYQFIKKKPNKQERQMAKIVLDKYMNDSNTPFEELYEQMHFDCINKIETDNSFRLSCRLSGVKRLRYLTELSDLGLEVRGNHWNIWQPLLTVFPEVMLCYSSEQVKDLETTQDFYNHCKLAFNINHIQAKEGFSWRVADILASNACLVTQKTKDLIDLGFNIPTYESKAEARDLCQRLLNDEPYRLELVNHCHEIINKNHRFENILPIMEDFLNMKLHDKKESGSLEIFCIDNFYNYKILKLKNKIRFKILEYINKKDNFNELDYKIYHHFSKKLVKKGMHIDNSKCEEFEINKIDALHEHYKEQLKKLKKKAKNKSKINVVFMVIYDAVFPGKLLFEKMLEDDLFEPSILVIPDILRGEENMQEQMQKAFESLSKIYGNRVHKAWDDKKKAFEDWSSKMDIVCSANPYDGMTHKYYRIGKLAKKGILPIYFNYGYPSVNWAKKVAALDSLSKTWKVFSESQYIAEIYSQEMKSKGKNLVVAGYMKMDELARQKIRPRDRKTVIIAPHHTIESNFDKSIGLSNFLTYSDLFKELPMMYPQIDFIFRPHPLLKVTLEKDTVWGKEKTEKYFEEIQQNQNLTYQEGGDYFETFANSDGIIHDCSSFLAEYMFTEKPVCYMLRNKNSIEKYFMENGKEILSHCYQAYKKEDILNFIENVILAGKDSMAEERIKFVNEKIKVNYPNVSDYVMINIKEEILK